MQELKELTREIRLLREDTKEIYVAIQGNERLGQKGLKHTIEDHGARIKELEDFRNNHNTKDEVARATESGKRWRDRILGGLGGASATATAFAPKSFWGKIFAAIQGFFSATN